MSDTGTNISMGSPIRIQSGTFVEDIFCSFCGIEYEYMCCENSEV